MKLYRRVLCWLGKHDMNTITDKLDGVMYVGTICSHCAYVDDDSIRSVLANRTRRRIVAKRARKYVA